MEEHSYYEAAVNHRRVTLASSSTMLLILQSSLLPKLKACFLTKFFPAEALASC